MMIKQKFFVWIIVSAGITNSIAQDLAVEHFDSLSGTLHQYQGDEAGWLGNWHNQNEYIGGDGYRLEDSNPMTHPVIAGLGNYCEGGAGTMSTGRFFSAFGTFVDHADADGRIGEGVIYFSFLIRKLEDNDTPIEIILADDGGSAWHINQELIKIGYFGSVSNNMSERYWSLATFNETQVVLSDSAISINETYQILVEIDFGPFASNSTTVNMWVNPENGIPDLLNPDASITSLNDLGFWNIVLFFDAAGTGHGTFDEFRFSDELSVVLPVDYILFKAVSKPDNIKLLWTTGTELSNDYFLIQRSQNGTEWFTIDKVDGNGNSSQPISYSYVDPKPLVGKNFYRLIQVDFDGRQNISHIIVANYFKEGAEEVLISQKGDELQINSRREIKRISITDLSGKILNTDFVNDNRFTYSLIDDGIAVYILNIVTEAGFWKQKILCRTISF